MKRIAFVVCGLFACGDDAEPSAETEVTTPEVIEEAETEVAETEVGDVAETEVAETEVSAETADAEVTPDAPDTTDPDELGLRFELAGSIAIVEVYSDGFGGVAGSYVLPDLRDRKPPTGYVEKAAAGACVVWTRADAVCTPQCGEGLACDAAGACVPIALPASAGTLTITGLVASPMTATPTEFGYTMSPEPPADGLFDAGDVITVAASGAAIGAFEASVTGVSDMHIDGVGYYELVDDQDTTVTWRPANDGSDIEVLFQVGWHGAPPTGVIACRAPDAAGQVVVPAVVVNELPYLGAIALFQNPSWIERVSRTVVDTAQGPIEITASSRVNVGLSHAPASE